ncbi:unnamed protein product [Cercopithifilaria johnstoni]|uniref:Uncharacterized protein n=1 Tax=Cercopithifilaria johnstoni TaxID=2874296 RepID=A0A8J2MGN3_9BILA|nr:unnamed protein product [Cercopithifilaria johnstoni]
MVVTRNNDSDSESDSNDNDGDVRGITVISRRQRQWLSDSCKLQQLSGVKSSRRRNYRFFCLSLLKAESEEEEGGKPDNGFRCPGWIAGTDHHHFPKHRR